ncbi:MAG: hypothetical protein ACK5XN_22565, partial [Bacteroidota bacterium]
MQYAKHFTLLRIAIFFLLTIAFYCSCTYNKEDELYQLACDTVKVTYDTHIKGIMVASCLNCHGVEADRLGNGIRLETYEEVKSNAEGIFASVTRTINRMPKGGAGLPQCTI